MVVNKEGRVTFGIVIILMIVCVLAPVLVCAQDSVKRMNDSFVALNNIKCKTEMIVNLTQYIDKFSNENNITTTSELGTTSSKLLNDYNYLAENVLDREMFHEYLLNDFNPNFNSTRIAIETWKKENYNNLTSFQKRNLIGNYNNLNNKYNSCESDSIKKYGNSRLASYNIILDNYQSQTDLMKEKGVDTSKLDKVLIDSKTEIILPLQNSLKSAKNSKDMIIAIKSYCLFDGCSNGTNYHFDAKFSIARLEIVSSLLKENSSITTPENIKQLDLYINNAKTNITNLGDIKYTNEQMNSIWSSIKEANNIIKEIKNILKINKGSNI